MNQIENHKKEIYAGIVTYNPDIQRLSENINAVISQVDGIVIVDNGSKNITEIRSLIATSSNIALKENYKNMGIAKALNQIMTKAQNDAIDWVLTLDQDSVVYDGLITEYKKYWNMEKVGIFTCYLQDRNAKGIGGQLLSNIPKIQDVALCPTSGCLTNVSAWRSTGGFDEKMFIDYVDFDMCVMMRKNGYYIKKINYLGLLHEIGNSKDVSFLGRKLVVGGHSSFRKYYIVRNRIYYMKKHKDYIDVLPEIRHLAGFFVLTIIYEDNKLEKLKAMLKGLIDAPKLCKTIKRT